MSVSLHRQWCKDLRELDIRPAADWTTGLQAVALEAFERSGLPNRKVERWRYNDLGLMEGRRLRSPGAPSNGKSESTIIGADSATRLLFNRGQWSGSTGQIPDGLTLLPFRDGIERFQSQARPLIESLAIDGADNAFAAINTALLGQGAVIHVAKGVDAGRLVVHWADEGAGDQAGHESGNGLATGSVNELGAGLYAGRLVVLLDADARLVLLEQFGDQSPDSDNGFNLVTQVDIGEGAALHHVRLQVESPRSSLLTDSRIRLGADSLYSYTGVDLGGRSVRHDLRVRLAGEGASSELGGAWVADDEREIDNHVSVEHLAPGAASRQFFRGVLGGRSRGVFNGRALIAAGADGSSVRQSNANLLLSPLAEINAKPELEIYADEVEASHGATVGQLDEDALFYLRSRGLAEPEARQILTAAFCKAPIDRIDPAAITAQDRSVLEDLLHRRMAGVGRSAGE